MYQAILILKYGIARKQSLGSVAVYNNDEPYVKVIDGVSEEDCKKKITQFLSECQFKGRKSDG